MAIFICGMKCRICGEAIYEKDDAVTFPSFIMNKQDPLYIFNDEVVHIHCLKQNLMYNKMEKLTKELFEKMNPRKRICSICNNKISNPDDYIGLGCMSSDELNQLYNLNFKQYHKSCFLNSDEEKRIKEIIINMNNEGLWDGKLGF